MMTIFCVLFLPTFTLIRIKSRSVIAASILHGSFNALAGIAVMLVQGGNDLLIGNTGLAGLLVIGGINLIILRSYSESRNKSIDELESNEKHLVAN
jgi:uncharacterized protein